MAENLNAMKLDVSGLLHNTGFGTQCVVARLSTTKTASGRYSGSYANVASGTFLIQPAGTDAGDGAQVLRRAHGFHEGTTHVIFAKTTANVVAEDRLTPSGSTYWYDVIAVHSNPSHLMLEAKRVKKS